MLPTNLSNADLRVLGALIEKQLSTPDHYPLSMNALIAACNQTTNRDPVTSHSDSEVSAAVDSLRRQSLVRSFQGSGERVPKYQHLLAEACELSAAETALLCVLMLRGPQTLAEIRTRAARLLPDGDADAIQKAAESLASAEGPLVTVLARRAGQKEVRYAHCLGDDVPAPEPTVATSASTTSGSPIDDLYEQIAALRSEHDALRAEFLEFRRQLE